MIYALIVPSFSPLHSATLVSPSADSNEQSDVYHLQIVSSFELLFLLLFSRLVCLYLCLCVCVCADECLTGNIVNVFGK